MKIVLPAIILAIIMLTAAAGVDITYLLNKKLEQKQEDKKWEDAFIDKLSSFISQLEDKARINLQDKEGNVKSTQKSFNKTTEITIENHPIKRIKINNATGNHTIKIDQPEIPNAIQTFVIDPTETQFTNGEIEIIAKGNQLYKCPTWNYTTGICEPTCTWDDSEQQNSCEPKWIYQKEITPGQQYTIEITPNDPAYYETSTTNDVALAPYNKTTFLVGFIDTPTPAVSFRILNTNGTIIVNTTTVDNTINSNARVDVAWINSSHFVIFWADTTNNDATFQIFSFDGTSTTSVTGPTDADTGMGGINVDVSLAILNDRFITCYANDADSDADFRAFDFTGTQLVGETAADGNMQPSMPLQNLIDCTRINGSRFAYFWFDDSTVNDATYSIRENTGTSVTTTDIDTDVGETGQVAVTSLNPSRFGMVWYDSTDQDITIAIRDAANTAILAATDIDTAAGTDSRVAAGTIRKDSTSTEDLLIAVWQDQAAGNIQAAVYYQNGTQLTAPFQVTSDENSGTLLIDAIGRDEATDLQICPGRFIVAFSNSSGQGEFLGFYANGTSWDGTCDETTGPTITPAASADYLLNETAEITANITDPQGINITFAHIIKPDGTLDNITLNLTGNATYSASYTNTTLRGTYNITYFAKNSIGQQTNETGQFRRTAFDIIDIIIPMGEMQPTLENFTFANYTTTIISNISGLLNISVNITDAEIRQINITNHDENSPQSIIEIFDDEDETLPTPPSFTSYSINPEGLNFTTATLLLNASGNSTLMKCADYNFTEQHCNEGNWTEHLNITKGQTYTVTINATDPSFIETTAAGDVAMSPLSSEIFLIGFVDIANTEVSFEIVKTNGSIIVAETNVDTSVSTNARVDVNWINSSHFVIFWADTSSNDATFQIFSFNGTATTSVAGPTDVDTSMGSTNVDVSLAMLDNRFITCYANDADSDADFQAYDFTGTQVVAETAVDGNIQPSSPLQNLIDCSATTTTRWTYFTFDDSTVNDATYYILDNTGASIVGATDIDTDVGETGQVAVMGLNGNISGLVWYDATDQDISIAGVSNTGTTIFGPTDVDTAAGTESRVAGAGVRENSTSTSELFAFAWWSQDDATVKASVYTSSGAQFTSPFNVSTSINSTYPIIDITGKDNMTGQEICPGTFIVAFSNGSTGTFLGFWVNGTSWNGTCPTDLIATNLTASNLNPDEQENVTFNATVFNNGTVTAENFVNALVDGNCTTGTMIQNITLNLSAGQNTTLNFSWNATPVGPHNISFCVNYYNTTLEYNYSNNNITITINVKAYNDYFGNLSGNVTLDTSINQTEYDWGFNDSGNVIFTDSDLTINFSNLYALGRTTAGGVATNDFSDADTALNMTGFNDSIQILWATNASNPKQTTTFTVRGRTITNVPYINSTNTSNFITGILWDASNDTGGQFDPTQKEPLLFVTMINRNQTGFYGTYDYEAHVPVLLRSYNSGSDTLQYFVELR